MMQNDKLRAEADRRRSTFFQTASALSTHVTPAKIMDELVGALDPDFRMLNRLKAEGKRNPFALVAAVGGIWLLSRQIMTIKNTGSRVREPAEPTRRPHSNSKLNIKGLIEKLAPDDITVLNERT